MADWTVISDSQVDPDAPITSELGYAFRDNPIAIAEGAAGAPRVTRTALLGLTSGGVNTITQGTFNIGPPAPGSGGASQTVFTVSCFLGGSVSVFTNLTAVAPSGVRGITIYRVRDGVSSTMATYDTVGTRSDVVNVARGDKIVVSVRTPEGAATSGSAGLNIGNDSAGVVVL